MPHRAPALTALISRSAQAGAGSKGIPLYKHIAQLAGNPDDKFYMPVPSFNIINGGSHAGNKLAMQEFMILPIGATNFTEAMKMGSEVYHNLKSVIKKKYGQDACNVGDEGGFAPNILDNKEGLDLVVEAIEKAGYTGKVKMGMDVAASEFWKEEEKVYDLDFKTEDNDKSQCLSGEKLLEMYEGFVQDYPMVSIEDPFDQDDFETYTKMTEKLGKLCQVRDAPETRPSLTARRELIALLIWQVVGDDLLVTNPTRVKKAIDTKAANALLLKVNQIGSITEAIEAVNMSKAAGWAVMTSHRSGETEDSFIADLAVGLKTGQIKTGAPCRSERLSK